MGQKKFSLYKKGLALVIAILLELLCELTITEIHEIGATKIPWYLPSNQKLLQKVKDLTEAEKHSHKRTLDFSTLSIYFFKYFKASKKESFLLEIKAKTRTPILTVRKQ